MIRNPKVEIKRMWETGQFTNKQIVDWLNKNGFKPPRADTFNEMIVADLANKMGLGRKPKMKYFMEQVNEKRNV